MGDSVGSPRLAIRVVYHDLPDLIEIEARVTVGEWCGVARSYTGPENMRKNADALAEWTKRPRSEFTFESGADTGIGWLSLRFYPIDQAGHLVCHVRLATDGSGYTRPEAVRRLALEIATEPGLVEHFARHLASLAETLEGEAVLIGISN